MKRKVEEAAEKSARSMTAEIVARLEETFSEPSRLEQLFDAYSDLGDEVKELKGTIKYLEEVRKTLETELQNKENDRESGKATEEDEPIFNIVLDAKGHPLDWPNIAAHIHRTAKAAGLDSVGFRAAIFDTKKLDDPYDQEYRRLVRWYQEQTRKHKAEIRGEED
ncbi:Arc family DNA-binding protein [Rhizobium sp. TRM96647]|uniref:Arc family DNA-binding protein n=1 Tax=unclassified Rhizobium TaxID=2613769 RepID=UPI0021E8DB96|nr:MULTISPECIES: Arc family DNA-binding protein [unclassified Rhizobium]MCV3738354.1 Arc family DNA-binding protein [Rhizobium sp. TRM96647]MCV3759897.1 Arc family DNA-binding protein [Rhizobium sp. TRM96650]